MHDSDISILPIGCVIMASGHSRRFGGNKLLTSFQGEPLLFHILRSTEHVPFEKRLVVTRCPDVAKLCQKSKVPVVLHDLPDRNDTVRVGLSALISDNAYPFKDNSFSTVSKNTGSLSTNTRNPISLSGCMFCLADQPFLSPESLKAMLLAFSRAPENIFRLSYKETPGSPILFPAEFFSELLKLPTGHGGSFLAKKYPGRIQYIFARDEAELYDIDSREDLIRLSGFFK